MIVAGHRENIENYKFPFRPRLALNELVGDVNDKFRALEQRLDDDGKGKIFLPSSSQNTQNSRN